MENSKEQLCWSCKKACGGYDCPWANKLKPVEGWTAKETSVQRRIISPNAQFMKKGGNRK